MGLQIAYLRYRSTCPLCGEGHDVVIQSACTIVALVGATSFRVGDAIELDPVTFSNLTTVRPHVAGDPLVVIEEGVRCHGSRVWTELVVARGVVESLRLVDFDLAQFERTHLLPPRGWNFWSWAWDLVGTSNPDLRIEDPVRKLRLKVWVRSVLPARTLADARLAIAHFGFDTGGLVHEPDKNRWVAKVATYGETFDMYFNVDDPTNEPTFGPGSSKIVPPDAFLLHARDFADIAPDYPSDLADDTAELERTRLGFRLVATYLEQVLAFVPEGAELVPVDAFWGDAPRATRERYPRRFSREWLQRELDLFRRDLEHLEVRPVGHARSAIEADAYLRVHPCPRCGTATPALPSRIVSRGDTLVSVYDGRCPTCSLPRQFELVLDENPPPNVDNDIEFGRGRSSLLDPGQWLAVADHFAKLVPADNSELPEAERDQARYRILLAIAAIDEVIKFIEKGATTISETAFHTRAGWRVYMTEPGRFERKRLVAVWEAYNGVLSGITVH